MQTAPFVPAPWPAPIYTEGKALGGEITRLCAHIHAATYRLLVLIREFDEKKYWGHPGLCSCAHWLNFECGIGMNAAREKVRVARALKDLPGISERFRKGELSYSKVRAMTRVADSANEEYLLMIAKHGTAHHVEKLVSLFRRCKRLQDTQNANRQQATRALHCHVDDDGSMVIRGRIPAEQGAMIMKALELAMDRAGTSQRALLKKDTSGITAVTSGGGVTARNVPDGVTAVTPVTLAAETSIYGHHVQHWADGGETSLENLVLLCRLRHRMVHEGGYSCERHANGDFVFTDPYQRLLPSSPTPNAIDTNPEFGTYIESWLYDLNIDERTCIPHWMAGDIMNWDLAVWHMFQIEERE